MSKCIHKFGVHCKLGHHNYLPSKEDCESCVDYEGTIRGAGDVVHLIAKSVGLDKLSEKIESKTKKPCGCNKRRTKLNQLLPRKTD